MTDTGLMDYLGIPIIALCLMSCVAAILYRLVSEVRHVRLLLEQIVLAPTPIPSAPIIKVVMPADIQRATRESGMVRVEHRQPDGNWQEIGDFQIPDESDQSSWPKRVFDELKSEGRRLVLPSGRIIETLEDIRP